VTKTSVSLRLEKAWPPKDGLKEFPGKSICSVDKYFHHEGVIWILHEIGPPLERAISRTSLADFSSASWKVPGELELPEEQSLDLAVINQYLFISANNVLLRCDMATKEWRRTEIPTAVSQMMAPMPNGDLIIAGPVWKRTSDNSGASWVATVKPKEFTVKIIASSRAAGLPLNFTSGNPFPICAIFPDTQGRLLVSAERKTYSYTGDAGWTEYTLENVGIQLQSVSCKNGYLLVSSFSPYLASFYGNSGENRQLFKFKTVVAEAKGFWQYPKDVDFFEPLQMTTRDGQEVWFLRSSPKTATARNTLYWCRPGKADPVSLTLIPTENLSAGYNGTTRNRAFFAAPQGLVISGFGNAVFWLVPYEALTRAISN